MKRKFFSSLLMMVFAVASVGMFVSCKDYDDDIQKVNTDVSNLAGNLQTVKADLEQQLTDAKSGYDTQISQINEAMQQAGADQDALSAKIDELTADYSADVARLEASIAAAQEAINAAQADRIQEALEGYAALTGKVDEFTEDVEGRIAAATKNIEMQQEALDLFEQKLNEAGLSIDGLTEQLAAANVSLEDVKAAIAASNGDIDTLKEQMGLAENAVDDINDQLSLLMVYIEKILSGLVFAPDFYYGGIEAMEAPVLYYTPVILDNNSTQANPLENGETWAYATTGEVSTTPSVVANYHMNPSYYDVANIKSMNVISDDKEYVAMGGMTRAAASAPAVQKYYGNDNGLLSVVLDLDGDKISRQEDEVTVLAVQAHINADGTTDSTVTSDYAAVAKSDIKNIDIADKTLSDPRCSYNAGGMMSGFFHIYDVAAEAIATAPTHEIIYDDQNGVNLLDLVQMHYIRNYAANESAADDVSKYGLKWQFELSHYTRGGNATSESVHARFIDEAKTKIVACKVDEKGNPVEGVADRTALGRTPMVRVTLVDTLNNNKVVSVGFIKFLITEKDPTPSEAITIEFPDNGVDLNCDGYNRKLTWAEVEAKVLGTLNMSKEEFENNYEVEKISGNTCQLYEELNGTYVKSSNYGTVVEHPDPNHNETSVLEWTIDGNTLYNAVWDPATSTYMTGQSLTTIVRFAAKNSTSQDVYVVFNTGEIYTPTASWENTNKLSNYWAAANSKLGSGYDEIHNNILSPDDAGTPAGAGNVFENNILSTLEGNKVATAVTMSGNTATGSFAEANLLYEYKFVIDPDYAKLTGQSGTEYTMTVDASGKVLSAYVNSPVDAQVVATLSTTSGSNVDGNYVTYVHGAYAHDLLNAVSHDVENLAKCVTASVGLYAKNGCDFQLPIANNVFDVKFLRPIDAEGAKEKTFVDAGDKANMLKLYELVEFGDWRDVAWKDSYVAYYGITSIDPVISEITTTMDGGTLGQTLLSDKSNLVRFYKDGGDAASIFGGVQFGYLVYDNNGQVLSTFQIRVPLDITYYWGTLRTYVDITINNTGGNNLPARR